MKSLLINIIQFGSRTSQSQTSQLFVSPPLSLSLRQQQKKRQEIAGIGPNRSIDNYQTRVGSLFNNQRSLSQREGTLPRPRLVRNKLSKSPVDGGCDIIIRPVDTGARHPRVFHLEIPAGRSVLLINLIPFLETPPFRPFPPLETTRLGCVALRRAFSRNHPPLGCP